MIQMRVPLTLVTIQRTFAWAKRIMIRIQAAVFAILLQLCQPTDVYVGRGGEPPFQRQDPFDCGDKYLRDRLEAARLLGSTTDELRGILSQRASLGSKQFTDKSFLWMVY